MTLLLRRARLMAASISRSLRSAILVDPGADRHLETEFGRDRRNQFDAAGGGIEADRPRNRRQLPQIVADLLNRRDVVDVRYARFLQTARRTRSAGFRESQVPAVFPEKNPITRRERRQPTTKRRRRRASQLTIRGLQWKKANPSPRFVRHGSDSKDNPATRFNNWYDGFDIRYRFSMANVDSKIILESNIWQRPFGPDIRKRALGEPDPNVRAGTLV